MTRLLLCLCVAVQLFAAGGQLQLFVATPGEAEQLVTSSIQMGSVAASDIVRQRLRIRNTGDASITLTTLSLAGRNFTMTGAPSLPHIVAVGMNVDFTVEFQPPDYGTYSANLSINAAGFIVRGSSFAAAGIYRDGRPIVSGDTIDFGRVEIGEESNVSFEYRNDTPEPVSVSRATLTSGAFSFPAGPPTPYLDPRQRFAFPVRFRPETAGVFEARMTIDKREFKLTGTGVSPQMPRPAVVVETGAIRSGEQGRISVRFAAKVPADAKGSLRMELQPAGNASDNDAAAQFSSGSRTVSFDVAKGADEKTGITFQAGTTAGTLVFTVEIGGFKEWTSVVVQPEAVRLDRSGATRGASTLDVQLTGFDNTRSLSAMNFTFYSTAGQPLAGMPIRVPVSTEFEKWWSESKLGGMFTFRASFPVTGDVSQVAGVEVEVVNASGASKTQRLSF